MKIRPAGGRLLIGLLLWIALLGWAVQQTTGPSPERDWHWGDLLTLRGWLEPVGLNTARGRTVHLTPTGLTSVHFVNEELGWAVGTEGAILNTQNGGLTWQAQNSGSRALLYAVAFSSATQGWVVGEVGTILNTQDGGQTWQAQSSGTTEVLTAVTFSSATQGWAVGDGGTILSTQNGGLTWQAQRSGTREVLTAVTFTSTSDGWVVGTGGTILSTKNAGQTWQAQSSGTSEWLHATAFSSASSGWVVGDGGTILRTQNGGQTWEEQNSGNEAWFRAVTFASPSDGWVVGHNGIILSTQNGGQTWQSQSSNTNEWLRSVSFISAIQGWVVGDGGTLLSTQNSGQTWKNISPNHGFWREVAMGTDTYSLWPAPGVVLANVFVLIFLFRSGVQQARYARATQPIRGGVHDSPIDDLQGDRLQRAPVVRSLAQLFRNQDTKPPLAVALSAPWGVGKSSVLGMLRNELRGYARCVYINPWHYPQDSQLLAALMTGICKEAVPPILSLDNFRFRGNLFWYRVMKPYSRWLIVSVVFLYQVFAEQSLSRQMLAEQFARSEFAHVWPSMQQTWLNMSALVPETLLAWFGDAVKAIFPLLFLLLIGRSVVKRLYTFSPSLTIALAQSAQWAARSMSLPDWSQHAGLRHQFAQDFREIAQAFGPQRLVLLIDDLDRCEPHQVAQTLATLNFVFTNQAPCFVVLAMDRDYVQHALGLAYKDMALAMRDGQAKTRGDTANNDTDDNTARLNFARQYLRKLVQIEISLSHDASQGARLVLDTLGKEENSSQVSEGNTQREFQASLWGWIMARGRYHWTQFSNGCSYAASGFRQLNWQRLQLWRWSMLKQNLRTLVRVILMTLKFLVHVASAVFRWVGLRLGLGFKAVLDARLHFWGTIGNTLLVAAGSYIAAVFVTGLVAVALPVLVPETVQETMVKAMVSQDSKDVSIPIAGNPSLEAKFAAELQTFAQTGAGRKEVFPPDTNQATLLWPLINLLALLIFVVVIAIRAQQTVRDSEGFLKAVRHWHELLSPRFPNPREWKRLSNMARFLAMRVRADQYQSLSLRLIVWWQVQLRWAKTVLNAAQAASLPSPASSDKPLVFRLSEGAAVELWMLDCLSQARMRKLLPDLLRFAEKDNQELETELDVAKSLSSFEEFISHCFVNPDKGKDVDSPRGATHIGVFRRMIEMPIEKLTYSPNLPELFQAWRMNKKAACAALRQWLAWIHDIKMDIPDDH